MATRSKDLPSRLRVPASDLTVRIDERTLGFASTSELSPLEGTIGQDRALRALEFGLRVATRGFNAFVTGIPGSGRNTTLASYLKRVAEERPVPGDWVYVSNFVGPMKPRGIGLPAGLGRRLAQGMRFGWRPAPIAPSRAPTPAMRARPRLPSRPAWRSTAVSPAPRPRAVHVISRPITLA